MGLKEIRESKGMSIYRISKDTGISQTMLSAFERGEKDLTLKKACKVAKILNCKVEKLI